MISRAELQRLANQEKVALGTLETDYVLTEALNALSNLPALGRLLVFKGGTALRKVYFADWRYSEDLDFTAARDLAQQELVEELEKWYALVEKISGIQLATRMLHKPNGYARVRCQFHGPLSYPGMIFMDLSFDEPVCLEPDFREILSAPFQFQGQKVLVYPLEELLAEKIRSLLERGKSRDYYDVWRLLSEHPDKFDSKLVASVLMKKLNHKGLTIWSATDLLPADTETLKRYWNEDLRQQVRAIPPLDEVLVDLRDRLKPLVALTLTPD
ncbi:MAG: nucleotidyl transferase AbiEii/AbiGii toxin family protein [Chloroflexi bacterium]|nr:nucleotidyl transferase AbiEii/AbiGii toxin family protein [Chloroflexota bacterium]